MIIWLVGSVLILFAFAAIFFYRNKWVHSNFQLQAEIQKRQEQQAFFENSLKQTELSFKSLASDVLDQNSQRFLQMANEKLEKSNMQASFQFDKKAKDFSEMVKPIQDLMSKMEKDLQDVEKSRSQQFSEIKESIRNVGEINEKLRNETSNLSSALKKPGVRGSWGEIQLRRVVELAGMSSYCDFQEQASVRDEAGNLFKPDLVVMLPNERQIVVDAKAVMDSFLSAIEEKDSERKQSLLKKHAAHLRSRVKDLSKKSYWEQFEASPEFVVLFIPNEALLSAAVEVDPNLIEDALNDSIIIATPTTLVALLKAVAYGWQQDQVQQNAKHVVAAAKEFYQRLSPWLKALADTGTKLDSAVKSYNDSIGSLESRVLPSVRRMKEMAFSDREELETAKPIDRNSREPKEIDS